MKKNLKQALVPLAVMVFGAAAAFATNAAKQTEKTSAVLMTGYHYDISKPIGDRCVRIEVDCNPFSGEICTDGKPINPTQYWKKSDEVNLQCSELLFKNID